MYICALCACIYVHCVEAHAQRPESVCNPLELEMPVSYHGVLEIISGSFAKRNTCSEPLNHCSSPRLLVFVDVFQYEK